MKKLSKLSWVGVVAVSVGSFHLAQEVPGGGILMVLFLSGIFLLAHVGSVRWAFWSGLGFGLLLVVPQVTFFWGIFKTAAVPLWMVLAFWIAVCLALANAAVRRWPRWGVLAIPFIWTGCEYFRSELYYLRFSWLSPGLALADPPWLAGLTFGSYGFSFMVLAIIAGSTLAFGYGRRLGWGTLAGGGLAAALLAMAPPSPVTVQGPYVVGIQLEFPQEVQVMRALDQALRDHPDVEVIVLGEYTFLAPIPPEVRNWCRDHARYVIAGGMEPIGTDGAFYNMAYVVDPTGDIAFSQAKSVPIQFFTDGTPAPEQRLWASPWGAIGIAICYDLSYTRVMDELVRQGAQSLIIPTLDAEEWGERQHDLHAKVAPVRAREYGVAIVRVATSGISQLVDAEGHVLDDTPFAVQNVTIAGYLPMSRQGRLPLDRWLAPICVVITVLLCLYFASERVVAQIRRRQGRRDGWQSADTRANVMEDIPHDG